MKTIIIAITATILFFGILMNRVQATTYTYETFDVPGATISPGLEGTTPQGINDNGDISGYYSSNNGTGRHGFIRHADGTYTQFTNNSTYCNINGLTYLYGINNSGQLIAMCATTTYAHRHGVLRSADGLTLTFIDEPDVVYNYGGSDGTTTAGINDNGQVTGYYNVVNAVHGFIWYNGVFTTFDVPSSSGTYANGINNSGQVTGIYGGGYHGFIRSADGTQYVTFDVPTAAVSSTYPSGINDSGEVTGYFMATDAKYRGFVRSTDGLTYSTLAYPSATVTEAYGINNQGKVTGYYKDSLGEHGFIATPIIVLAVKVVGPPDAYFQTITAAYQSLSAGGTDIIEAQQGFVFTGGLDVNNGINLTLLGGYDSNFDTNPIGLTTLSGDLIVSSGSLTVSNIIVQ